MSDSSSRFKFLKKLSSKIDKLFLGDMVKSNSDSKRKSSFEDYYFEDNFNNEIGRNPKNGFDNSFNEKYDKYIYLDDLEREYNRFSDLEQDNYISDYENNFEDIQFNSNEKFRFSDFENKENFLSSDEFSNDNQFKQDKKVFLKSFNLKKLKENLLKSNDSSKKHFGIITFCLIFLILGSSIFYFCIYQPFQNELNIEKTAKLNELNTLYIGPLSLNPHFYNLKHQIEDAQDINEVKSIDVLRVATEDWRKYHVSKINTYSDPYGRIMMSYSENNSKEVLMPSEDGKLFVNENDGKILSNVEFEKVNTVIVPVSITRLQATGGLISVGSIVDIYSLSSNDSNYSQDSQDSDDIQSNSENTNDNDTDSSENNTENNGTEESIDNLNSKTSTLGSNSNESSSYVEPDVSGATVLAILRSKDSGVIDGSFSSSTNRIKGNNTYPTENSASFSTDVEELLKSSVFNAYDNNALDSYLNKYGLKLSNFERLSNIGELDTDYLILLEVPRSDVNFVINNMENLILTIPTEYAPNWAINELNQTYYKNLNSKYGYF